MGAHLKTFHLVESEPHPLVAAALDQALLERCRIERPVPIHFLPKPRLGGECAPIEDTREGELELSDQLLSIEKTEKGMANALVTVYLHEFSHRLTPGRDHDAAFFAVYALLFLRAGKNRYDNPFLHRLELYDLHEWHEGKDSPFCKIGEALDWALDVAGELADTEMSAETAAVEILARYEKWKAWKTAEPARVAKARAVREADAQQILELRGARWRWAAIGWLAGIVTVLMPRFL